MFDHLDAFWERVYTREGKFFGSDVHDNVFLGYKKAPSFSFFSWILSELIIFVIDCYSGNNIKLFPGAELLDKVELCFPESWCRIYYFTAPYS